ncbi:hypothetical protein IV38_GL001724 [Lactobacillus selangorensis]|uniref:Uncharacterized protein n=1 Tax=Lactobacillus selangorensis TaxID=81857 RepID=A0A0R2FSY6_9LACO|nr:hypothetical protein IV38_GL001724 [Lactobacillus selangorensis]KRN30644.1 hypothetical protein IV40_GL001831 [Lactobacillus selangorensis]
MASYGITHLDFVNSLTKMPAHLLLLTPVDEEQMVDSHTGFNVISGDHEIRSYLLNRHMRQQKWIDYRRTLYLDEVTPNEIAEMLYLGHMYTQLQSPFYYKLENDFVYLDLPEGMTKVYYRHLNQFETVFNTALLHHLRTREIEMRFWMRLRQDHLQPLSHENLVELVPVMEEGLLLPFTDVQFKPGELQIPFFRMKKRFVVNDDDWTRSQSEMLGFLVFDRHARQWHIRWQA